jgi:hypothetical protein
MGTVVPTPLSDLIRLGLPIKTCLVQQIRTTESNMLARMPGTYRGDIRSAGTAIRSICKVANGEVIYPADLAKIIKADPNWHGQPIMLGACDTGQNKPNGSPGFAGQLSMLLGVPVTRPLLWSWWTSRGLMGSASPAGPPKPGDPGPWKTRYPESPNR